MIAGTVETLVHVWFPYFFNVDIHEVICPSNSVKPTLREGGGGGGGEVGGVRRREAIRVPIQQTQSCLLCFECFKEL